MLIAEIGWNFMGDMELADSMIRAASDAGATDVKFQYWQEDLLRAGPWDDDGRREIYKSAQLDDGLILKLNSIAKECGLRAFYSTFSKEGLLKLHSLGQKVIKIPSHEIYNIELIELSLSLFDKVIISTGACNENELIDVAKACASFSGELVVMHCVSSYPCAPEVMNLSRLNSLKALFPNAVLGLSDHTSSTLIPAISAAFGVQVVEKHFTTDHELPGRDNKFALLPSQFSEMALNFNMALQACIYRGMNAQDSEQDIMKNYRGRWSGV
jgi:sialic acid synthase SpsE